MLLRFQLVSLSLICRSNDSANLLLAKDRIQTGGECREDVVAGLLAGSEVAALAEPQHRVEESEFRTAVGDRIMLAAHGTNADAAERENAGFDRRLAYDLDDFCHVDAAIEIGGIFQREMRHGANSTAVCG